MGGREAFEPLGDWIDGEFVLPETPGGEIALEDPGDTTRELGAFPFAHGAIDAAVAAARRAYPAWRDLGTQRRAVYLERFKQALVDEGEALAAVIATEVGKPLWEARAEVAAMRGKIDLTLGEGLAPIREQCFETPGQVARCRAHPRGVVAVLGPFNFPGHLVHGHVVPALVTGNTVVIKPSEHTAATGQLYARLAQRAGFPPGVLNSVQGDGGSGAALARHPGVDAILFTGSYAVGRTILEATLDQPHKLVALEMGGKNGVLVLEDADLDAAATAIAYGAAVTTGQRCSATSRAIVAREIADPLLARLGPLLSGLRVGHHENADVFMGPLISAAARRRHDALHRMAAEEAECLVRGGSVDGPRPGHYVRPSLHLLGGHRASSYQREEHFVPDVAVLAVESLDEWISVLDDTAYGLVASVFTRDRERFERVFRETRVGLLNWNASTVGASSRLPFGGVKQSGNDRPAGVLSSVYCTYPVSSTEVADPVANLDAPGFPHVRPSREVP